MQEQALLGFRGEFTEQLPLPFSVAGAVKFPNQAQFHPLKFVSSISKGLHIYEHTPVRELVGTMAVTDRGRVKAKAVIVATHFPFLNKHGSYFLKLYQHRSYVIALEDAQDVDGIYVDEAKGVCPSGISSTCFWWAAGIIAPGNRAGHGGSCGDLPCGITRMP